MKLFPDWLKPLTFALPSLMVSYTALASPAQTHGQLRVEGTKMVGLHGDPVALRGMSLFWSQWGGKYYTPEAIAWLAKDWQCDVVRVAVGVHAQGYLTNPEAEVAKAVTAIEAAIANGLYVIIDWHAHEPEPELAAAFFAKMAKRYGHLPNVIYELWNEPLRDHDWATVVKPYHEHVLASIREHDPDNVVLLGTPFWSQNVDEAAADPVQGDNLAYVLHFYAGSHGQALRDKADAARALGVALFVSEWGTSMANGNDGVFVDEAQAWIDYMRTHDMGWCNWSLFDKDESSAALMPGASERGGWDASDVSPSGRFVRDTLRKKDADATPAER